MDVLNTLVEAMSQVQQLNALTPPPQILDIVKVNAQAQVPHKESYCFYEERRSR